MKGITFITDETHKKRFVQIDLSDIKKLEERLEDIFDVIISEARKNEPTVSWNSVKKHLRKKGKL
jgi:hypothetical protein